MFSSHVCTSIKTNTFCHPAGATGHSGAYFGEGRGPVNLDSVQCTGSEYSLTDCEIEESGRRTTHSLDVGVKCQPGTIK